MKYVATKKADPINYSGTIDFTTDELDALFSADAPPEVRAAFYDVFGPDSDELPVSMQLANVSKLAAFIEALPAKVTTSGELVPKRR